MQIRPEVANDSPSVHLVNTSAFSRPAEARLVEVLRNKVKPLISLVAEDKNIIGHILFSPVRLTGFPDLKIMGLGPVAVMPARQKRGIGSALIRAGLEKCRELGIGTVVVLGHPEYYPRFGFVRAKDYGIACESGPCGESFMLLELRTAYLKGAFGLAKYHEAFRAV
jgi:putative acetyltransferase